MRRLMHRITLQKSLPCSAEVRGIPLHQNPFQQGCPFVWVGFIQLLFGCGSILWKDYACAEAMAKQERVREWRASKRVESEKEKESGERRAESDYLASSSVGLNSEILHTWMAITLLLRLQKLIRSSPIFL